MKRRRNVYSPPLVIYRERLFISKIIAPKTKQTFQFVKQSFQITTTPFTVQQATVKLKNSNCYGNKTRLKQLLLRLSATHLLPNEECHLVVKH